MNKGISFSMGWYGGLAFGLLMAEPSLSDNVRRGFILLFIAIFAGIALVFHSWGEPHPESAEARKK